MNEWILLWEAKTGFRHSWSRERINFTTTIVLYMFSSVTLPSSHYIPSLSNMSNLRDQWIMTVPWDRGHLQLRSSELPHLCRSYYPHRTTVSLKPTTISKYTTDSEFCFRTQSCVESWDRQRGWLCTDTLLNPCHCWEKHLAFNSSLDTLCPGHLLGSKERLECHKSSMERHLKLLSKLTHVKF